MKAELRCYNFPKRKDSYNLVIENVGKAIADELEVVVDKTPIRQHIRFRFADFTQLDRGIQPHGRIVLTHLTIGFKPNISHVRITWQNPDGSSDEYATGL